MKKETGRTLVIGATGNVGRHVVSKLMAKGASVRALTRDPGAAVLPDGVDLVQGDLSDQKTLSAILQDVETVFLVWPLFTSEHAPAVVEAVEKHARRIVYLSSMGVRDGVDRQTDPINTFHAEIEGCIRDSELEWTFLRPSGFATNTLGWAEQIRNDGIVRLPHGAASRSLIHERDIAAVAVHALLEEGHLGETYVLTGPETLTQIQQARIIGEVIGKKVRWDEISEKEALERMLKEGWPQSFAEGALEAWARMVIHPEPITPTVEKITGKQARTFRGWALDHALSFQ